MDYKQNETVTITLERYEELKEFERKHNALKRCFDIFLKRTNPLAITDTTFIRTDTAKEQIEKVAACLGYKCADNAEQDK